jgi:hypothetical protein
MAAISWLKPAKMHISAPPVSSGPRMFVPDGHRDVFGRQAELLVIAHGGDQGLDSENLGALAGQHLGLQARAFLLGGAGCAEQAQTACGQQTDASNAPQGRAAIDLSRHVMSSWVFLSFFVVRERFLVAPRR